MLTSISNRHKVGLFLTTIVVGLCLILGSTLRETAGVVIIGSALTWAFGSASRMLRYCIGGLGVLGFIAPLVVALADHHSAARIYNRSLESFRSNLPQFAKEHLDLSAGLQPTEWNADGKPIRTFTVPNVGDVSFPLTMSAKDIAKTLRTGYRDNHIPDWYFNALDAGVSPGDIGQLTPPLDEPKAIDLRGVIADGVVIEAPAAILAILFFGSLVAERKNS